MNRRIDKIEHPNRENESLPAPSIMLSVGRKLNLSHLGLAELPSLPKGLIELDCSHNQLTALPPLPSSLQMLICSHNQLTSLPTLPPSLVRLICTDNQLTALPPFPRNLRALNCENNRLTALHPLPVTVLSLVCKSNRIQFLPPLPQYMCELRCEDNPLEDFPELPPYLSTLTYKLPIDDHVTEFTDLLPEFNPRVNLVLRSWAELMATESKWRCVERCAMYKEEIMMKTWHPSRVYKLLEMGYAIEDM